MSHPESYANLPLQHVKLAHHPASSSAVTPIVLVILNRPRAKNAFTGEMIESLVKAFNLLSSDPRVRCVILTGCDPTNRVFCPGMDLTLGSNDSAGLSRDDHRDGGGRVSLAIYNCQKPVIAALNGSAVGVGITMTLPASIRIASNQSKVGFVFARRGLALEACSSFFLPRLLGASRAMHLVTTGSVYPAGDELVRGLFSEIVEPAEVLPRALALAEEIAANTSAVSTAVMKEMIYRSPGSPEEAHLLESKIIYDMFRGKDFKEGGESFLQKRKADFQGTLDRDAPSAYPWWRDGKSVAGKAKI